MLKQLYRLSVEVDGRYATANELKFLKDYLDSIPDRVAIYEKVSKAEAEIIDTWEDERRHYPEDLFHMGDYDMSDICRRDANDLLRCATVAMLFDEMDRLKEGMLIWYETIVKAFSYKWYAGIDYRLMQDVIKLFLDEKEAAVMVPIFQLEQSVLSV